MRKFIFSLSLALCAAGLFAAGKPMGVQIERRGLPVVRGITTTANWPAINMVCFGPNWQYSAQDFAAKMTRKDLDGYDCDFNGVISIPGAKAKLHQEFRFNADGSCTAVWKLSPEGRPNLNCARCFVLFPLAKAVFDGGRMMIDGKEEQIPSAEKWLPKGKKITFISADGATALNLWNVECGGWKVTGGKDQYEIQMDFADPKSARETAVKFTFLGLGDAKYAAKAPPPKTLITNGTNWVEFKFDQQVKPGSIMDFSTFFENDKPAGKYGRLVPDKDGHLVYEKTGKRIRLVGANLNFSANTLENAERGAKSWEEAKEMHHRVADRLARQFAALGYNSIRYHHTDVVLQKGYWNHTKGSDLDDRMLDRLDYLFYAMKREGMYSTTDLYQMRRFGKDEVGDIGKMIDSGTIKAYIPVHDGVFNAWKMMATKLMNHVNPYTGIAWKDDPSLVFICPINEDSIQSVWGSKEVRPLYDAKFREWNERHPELASVDESARRARFLAEVKVESNRKIEKFLRELGVKSLITGANWWDNEAIAFERDSLEVVDNHGYADHPQGWPSQRWNQAPNTKCSHAAYHNPVMKANSRIFGKPMTITEWNFCMPNMYRAESGPTMGAYASLQDWDALYRFAWSHDDGNILAQKPMKGFDISNDPLNQLSERLTVLLFRRGDVSPAKRKLCYAVTAEEAFAKGLGDMWAKGLFPHSFTTQGFLHQTGSQVVGPGRPIRGKFDKVVSANPIPSELLGGNEWIAARDLPELYKSSSDLAADNGEITLNRAGRLLVATPRTEAIVAYPKGEKDGGFTAGGLKVGPVGTMTVVSASSMDGLSLRSSKRIFMMHLTNVYNSGMYFEGPGLHEVRDYGKLPYLARTGKAEASLKSDVAGMKLYAVRYDGTRIREVPMKYENGVYSFRLEIGSAQEAAMVYEMVAK